MERDLNEVESNIKRVTFHNLSKAERAPLQKLQKMDIIIPKADKRGATVILDVKDYITEAVRQLNDIHSYEKLDCDPTSTYNEIINNAIDNFLKENELPEKVAQSLNSDKPKTPKFYTLPKIHKPNNPGRPVVISIDSHTSKISKYVDFYLQSLARQLPSYIQDTSHFLRKLNIRRDCNPDSILVTLDLKSLYTNIPNEEGIAAVREAISMSTSSKISSKVITTFLWLILTFSFEKEYLYPVIRGKCIFYTRYIDDIFLIWKGTEAELKEFFKMINSFHPTIKLDPNYSFRDIKLSWHGLCTKTKIAIYKLRSIANQQIEPAFCTKSLHILPLLKQVLFTASLYASKEFAPKNMKCANNSPFLKKNC